MENGPKLAIGVSVVMVVALGIRVGLIYKANHEPGPTRGGDTAERRIDQDFLVYRKKERPTTPADEKDLIGKTIWVAAGGQMDYYPDTGKHAEYQRAVGVLPGAEPLLVQEVFEQKAPTAEPLRIPAGQKQVLLGFTLPKSRDPKTLYALPVGDFDQGSYTFFSDDIFYYDDPHTMYNHWPASAWQHIDKHEAAPGMTEDQVAMALGQVATPSSESVGNRSIQYDNVGHPVTVVFENGKATTVTPGS
jgi:hypothetical protein